MRTRKEIEFEAKAWDRFSRIDANITIKHMTQIMVELLLDIRDLVEAKK